MVSKYYLIEQNVELDETLREYHTNLMKFGKSVTIERTSGTFMDCKYLVNEEGVVVCDNNRLYFIYNSLLHNYRKLNKISEYVVSSVPKDKFVEYMLEYGAEDLGEGVIGYIEFYNERFEMLRIYYPQSQYGEQIHSIPLTYLEKAYSLI